MSHLRLHYSVLLAAADVPSSVVVAIGVTCLCSALRHRFSWHSHSYFNLTTSAGAIIVASSALSTLHKLVAASSHVNVKPLYDQYLLAHGCAYTLMAWAAVMLLLDVDIHMHKGVVLGPTGNTPAPGAGTTPRRRDGDRGDTHELQPLTGAGADDGDNGDDAGDAEAGLVGVGAGTAGAGSAGGGSSVGTGSVDTDELRGAVPADKRKAARAKLKAERKALRRQRRRLRRLRPLVWVVGPPLVAIACMLVVTLALWVDAGVWGKGPAMGWQCVNAVVIVVYMATMAALCRRLGWTVPCGCFVATLVCGTASVAVRSLTKSNWGIEAAGYLFNVAWAVSSVMFRRESVR